MGGAYPHALMGGAWERWESGGRIEGGDGRGQTDSYCIILNMMGGDDRLTLYYTGYDGRRWPTQTHTVIILDMMGGDGGGQTDSLYYTGYDGRRWPMTDSYCIPLYV